MSEAVIKAAILIICLDTTFSFPQSPTVQYIVSVFIWFFAVIFSWVYLYYLSGGLNVVRWGNGGFCFISKKRPGWVRDIMTILIFHLISTTLVLFSMFRFCCSHSTNKATRGKKMPFVLTAVIYLLLTWAVELSIFCNMIKVPFASPRSNYWLGKAFEFRRVVILLVWLLFIPDLRKIFFCIKSVENEPLEISTGYITHSERNEHSQDVRALVLQHPKGEHSLTPTAGGIPLLPHTSLELVRQ